MIAQYECIACGGVVEIDTARLGPWAALGLAAPVDVICFDCGDPQRDGPIAWALYRGEEFRAYQGGFARSRNPHPRVAGMYHRDEKQRGAEQAA